MRNRILRYFMAGGIVLGEIYLARSIILIILNYDQTIIIPWILTLLMSLFVFGYGVHCAVVLCKDEPGEKGL